MRYVNTKFQIADLLTKGSFSSHQWNALCELAQVVPPSNSTAKAIQTNVSGSAGGDPGFSPGKEKREKTRLEKRKEWYQKKKRSNKIGSANLCVNVPISHVVCHTF
jgi:hypothetical protein